MQIKAETIPVDGISSGIHIPYLNSSDSKHKHTHKHECKYVAHKFLKVPYYAKFT